MTRRKPKPLPIPPVVPAVTQPVAITVTQRNWLREAVSDDQGLADMAYVAIGALTVAAIVTLGFVCVMAMISYHTCMPDITIGPDSERHIKNCAFDPLPVGQAAGLVFGAFAALIGSLAGYMAATKRASKAST